MDDMYEEASAMRTKVGEGEGEGGGCAGGHGCSVRANDASCFVTITTLHVLSGSPDSYNVADLLYLKCMYILHFTIMG